MSSLAAQVQTRPVRILLVEDNHGDVILVQQAFASCDMPNEIVFARDGEQALEILRRKPESGHPVLPDVILLDINLPKMDGKEVLSAIRHDMLLKTIPVIMLTSSNAEQDVLQSRELKADGYLLKPIDYPRFSKIYKRLKSVH